MKVSKRQLLKIIREEKSRLVNEVGILAPHPEELSMAKDELLGILQSMDPDEARPEIYSIIDELETLAETGQ